MIEIGDKVRYDGEVMTVVDIIRPRCKCKGAGSYVLEFDGERIKIPRRTKLEKVESIGLVNINITPHSL